MISLFNFFSIGNIIQFFSSIGNIMQCCHLQTDFCHGDEQVCSSGDKWLTADPQSTSNMLFHRMRMGQVQQACEQGLESDKTVQNVKLCPRPLNLPYPQPFQNEDPKIFIPKRKWTSIVSSNWQQKCLYFHYKPVKLDVLGRQNKIWTFGNPFKSKKLPICTLNSDLQSFYMLPIWGFADSFA